MIARSRRQLGPLTAEGKRYLARDHTAAVVHLALALGFARSLEWLNAWLYRGLLVATKVTSALLLTRINPAVVNARGARHPMSTRERVFFSVYIPTSLSIPIIAGLDVGGPGWTKHSAMELVVGTALWTVGTGAIVWALAVNAFFEPTVRIQHERGHRVCSSGPYRFVRHPGYAGAIARTAGIPLLLGSRWCFVPVAVSDGRVPFSGGTSRTDRDELPAGGGVLTPALALGSVLRRRLAAAEGGEFMHFRVLSG